MRLTVTGFPFTSTVMLLIICRAIDANRCGVQDDPKPSELDRAETRHFRAFRVASAPKSYRSTSASKGGWLILPAIRVTDSSQCADNNY